jgi:hypothetical protein
MRVPSGWISQTESSVRRATSGTRRLAAAIELMLASLVHGSA